MTNRPSTSVLAQPIRRPRLVIAAALMAACASADDRTVRDSASAVDSGELASQRLASDATLNILNISRLTVPIRTAANSFGVAEAVSVRQDDDTAGLGALGNTVDIVALPVESFERRLMSTRTSWYVLFARDRVVLAYGDSSRGAATIDSTNWWKVLQRRGVRVGRVDPAVPAGYRALLVMQLAELHYLQPKLAATLRRTSPGSAVVQDDAALVAALKSSVVDYIWTYESTARAANLRYVRLPPQIDLGELADSTLYAAAEIVVPPGVSDNARGATVKDTVRNSVESSTGDTLRLRGAAIVYGISILNDAPSPRHAERFLRFLFSDDGRRVLESAYLDTLDPMAVGSDLPPTILAALGDAAAAVSPVTDSTRDTATIPPKQP